MRQGTTPVRSVLWVLFVSLLPTFAPAADDEAPLPDSRLGYRTAPLLLLSRPDIRDDLGMNADQTASAQRAIRSMYVQAASLKGKPNTEATIRARRAIDEAMQGWIDSRLTPEQKARLVQIDLQWEGPSALISRPVVAEALNLTKEQRGTLENAVRRRRIAREQGRDDAERLLAEVALSCLGESQRENWKRMLGKPFSPRVAGRDLTRTTR